MINNNNEHHKNIKKKKNFFAFQSQNKANRRQAYFSDHLCKAITCIMLL